MLATFATLSCGNDPFVVPKNSSLLHVAKCPRPGHTAPVAYATELRSEGELRLWVDAELTQPFGAVRTPTVFGRAYSDDVWVVLVHDYAGDVCEGYVEHSRMTIVGVLDPSTL